MSSIGAVSSSLIPALSTQPPAGAPPAGPPPGAPTGVKSGSDSDGDSDGSGSSTTGKLVNISA
jgi:hypothetical protein